MDKPQIFFDMDGCIADFTQGYKDLFDRNAHKDDPFTIKQFCLTVPNFFRLLPVKAKGLELFEMLKDDYNIVFLTTPMKSMSQCKRDKIDWVLDNLGFYDVIFSEDKAFWAVDESSVLIDDMKYNLDPWNEAGGTAINFKLRNDLIIEKVENAIYNQEETNQVKKQLKEMVVETKPTEKEKESGNYKKGKINFKHLSIRIENPKGSIRFGFDDSGRKWISKMKCHYGYITGTEGADFDPIDCFIGPHLNKSLVFVVNQGKDGMFDEHKIMLGYDSLETAENAYLSNYQKGWDGLDSIKQSNTKKLRKWLINGNTNEPF